MIIQAAASPDPVTLPLLSDAENRRALHAHCIRAAAEAVAPKCDIVTGVWREFASALAHTDAQQAFQAIVSTLSAIGCEDDRAAASDALGAAGVEAGALGSATAIRLEGLYRETADPSALPCEMPGLHVTLRGVSDWRKLADAARKAVMRDGKRWRAPALGETVADRVRSLAWASASKPGSPHHKRVEAATAAEIDALSDTDRDAYDAYQEWSVAATREFARRCVVGFSGVLDSIPDATMPRAIDGPLYPIDALYERFTVGDQPARLNPDNVDAWFAEAVALATAVFASGKGLPLRAG